MKKSNRLVITLLALLTASAASAADLSGSTLQFNSNEPGMPFVIPPSWHNDGGPMQFTLTVTAATGPLNFFAPAPGYFKYAKAIFQASAPPVLTDQVQDCFLPNFAELLPQNYVLYPILQFAVTVTSAQLARTNGALYLHGYLHDYSGYYSDCQADIKFSFSSFETLATMTTSSAPPVIVIQNGSNSVILTWPGGNGYVQPITLSQKGWDPAGNAIVAPPGGGPLVIPISKEPGAYAFFRVVTPKQ